MQEGEIELQNANGTCSFDFSSAYFLCTTVLIPDIFSHIHVVGLVYFLVIAFENCLCEYYCFFNEFVADDFRERTPMGTVQVLTPGDQRTPQSTEHFEQSQPDPMSYSFTDSDAVEVQEAVEVTEEEADPLDKFLPPPPNAKCSEELQVSCFCIC